MSENLDDEGNITSLNITGTATGDNYPSTELFILDQEGNSIFWSSDKENGTVLSLIGGQEEIFSINMTLNLNDNGVFTSIESNGTTDTIDEWNKYLKELMYEQ